MRRLLVLVSVLGLVLVACGADPASTGSPAGDASTIATEAPAGTPDAGTVTDPADGSPEPSEPGDAGPADDATSDLPPAPDVPIPLADGTTISLAAIDKPVYLIFWAEW